MTDRIEEWNQIISAVEADYDADVYFYSGGIDDFGFGQITKAITQGKRRDRAILVMVTNGGLANAAYQIARMFQTQYDSFSLFCPSRCKSAGTLVALGANELIMDSFSELGPLDVQLVKQNEIFARKSGLLARSAFDAMADAAFELYERLMVSISLKSGRNVSFKLASELSATMASTMMSPIYAQVNPETVGGEHRDLNIAYEYGSRLVDCSSNASLQTVFSLVYGYPSHDFIIDAREAGDLFQRVNYPTESLYRMVTFVGDAAYSEANPSQILPLMPIEAEEDEENDDHDFAADGDEGEEFSRTDPSLDGGGSLDRPVDPEETGHERAGPAAKRASHGGKQSNSASGGSGLRLLKGVQTDT